MSGGVTSNKNESCGVGVANASFNTGGGSSSSNNNIHSDTLFDDKADFTIIKWLASFEPHNLPESLSNAFRLGPLQDKLKITKPIVWLANLSCDFKSAYATIDDPKNIYGPKLGGQRRSSDGKRTFPRPFTSAEMKRFEALQDEYHNQRWQNLLVLGYDPATAATMVGALRDKHMRVYSPPPLFTLSPRMIVTDEEKRMKMKATLMGYLDGLAKQAEKELLEDLDREIAEEKGNKGKTFKKKAKKKAAAAKLKKSETTLAGDSQQQPPPSSTAPAAIVKTESVEEKRRRIEFAVAEARRKQNEEEQLKLQRQKLQKEEEQRAKRTSSPGPLSPDQMKYLREQQQKQKPIFLENYNEKDRKIIREALKRTGLNEEDVTKDVTTSTEMDGNGMPYAWCCDFCKTATFPTFAEAALHETTCEDRPKTAEETEAANKTTCEDRPKTAEETEAANKEDVVSDGDVDEKAYEPGIEYETTPGNSVDGEGVLKAQESAQSNNDTIDSLAEEAVSKTTAQQRGAYAAKKLADKSNVNVAELVDSLALEWSEKKAHDGEPSTESSTNSEEKVADDNKAASTIIIPSVDYSDDESDSDDDLNLEQLVGRKTAVSRATPGKKATAATPTTIEVATLPNEKTVKQHLLEKDAAKLLAKKEKKKAAAAAKKEKKKAAATAAAAAAAAANSNQNVPKDNNSIVNNSTNNQKKVSPVVTEPAKELLSQSKLRNAPAFVRKSTPPVNQQNRSLLSTLQIAQVMKSSTIDYDDRVNDTVLPQPPFGRNSPSISPSFDQTSDLVILEESLSSNSLVSYPPQVQAHTMSSPLMHLSASQSMSPSVATRISSLTAENEVLTAKNNFLESENQSLRSEIKALQNQLVVERQSAVDALQRVQLKSYMSETARDAAEERATWLQAVLVDAVAEMTAREVVRAETNEAIKAVSYAAVQGHDVESPQSYQLQQMQSPHLSVLPSNQGNSHRPATNSQNSFSFEGDLDLRQFSSQNFSSTLPQAPWARDNNVFARLRRGDDA